jgi:hypothetical protein
VCRPSLPRSRPASAAPARALRPAPRARMQPAVLAAKGKHHQQHAPKKAAGGGASTPGAAATSRTVAVVAVTTADADLATVLVSPGTAGDLGAAFGGGALGSGEIDVAVADSDEELDCASRSGPIVPAGARRNSLPDSALRSGRVGKAQGAHVQSCVAVHGVAGGAASGHIAADFGAATRGRARTLPSEGPRNCTAAAHTWARAGVLGAAGLAGVSGEGSVRSSQNHHRCLVLDAAYR